LILSGGSMLAIIISGTQSLSHSRHLKRFILVLI
jgi:hypothetical protein